MMLDLVVSRHTEFFCIRPFYITNSQYLDFVIQVMFFYMNENSM